MESVEAWFSLLVSGRYDRHSVGPQSLYNRDPPNRRSLQSEMQDVEQVRNAWLPFHDTDHCLSCQPHYSPGLFVCSSITELQMT